MANQHNYPFQTGFRAHGRSSHPGQPRPPQTRSPRTSDKNQGQGQGRALFRYAVITAVICFGSAGVLMMVRRLRPFTLPWGFDKEAAIMVCLGAGFIAVALRHLGHATRPGGFSKLAQETIATVFFLGVGSHIVMDMTQAALMQGMLVTLLASLAIIIGGYLLNKAYP